jgi:lipopolysaccharide heptosyltransferase II
VIPDFEPRKLMVVRLSSMGDILLTTPFIRALRQRFPRCQLDYLTGSRYRELLQSNPHIDHLIIMDESRGKNEIRSIADRIKHEGYDVYIDLHGAIRSLQIRRKSRIQPVLTFKKYRFQRAVLILLKRNIYPDDRSMALWMLDVGESLGIQDDGDGLDLFVEPEIEHNTRKMLEIRSRDSQVNWIAMAPGARHFTKRWPVDRWVDLARRLTETYDVKILVLGDDKDRQLGKEIITGIDGLGYNGAGLFSLSESAAALSCCQVSITNDSGLLHMAAARRIPVVAIFGPTVRAFGFYPFRVPYRIVERSLPCRPCSTKGSSRCPLRHFRCMLDINPNDVFLACQDVISYHENITMIT